MTTHRHPLALLATVLLLCAGLFAAPPATAADKDTLSALRKTQLGLYSVMRDFHMLTVLSGDPQRDASLRARVEAIGKLVDGLPAKGGNAALDEAVPVVRAEWKAFRKHALANNITRDGETSGYVLVDMRAANTRLQAALAKAIAAIPPTGKRAQTDRLQATALLVQKITNEYAFVAADTTGGMAIAPGDGEQIAIDKLTLDVDRQVAQQLKEFRGNADVNSALQSVSSKWNFVRRHLLELTKQSVPFVVDRYAAQINDSYQLAIDALDP